MEVCFEVFFFGFDVYEFDFIVYEGVEDVYCVVFGFDICYYCIW